MPQRKKARENKTAEIKDARSDSVEENKKESGKELSWILWGIGILAVLFVVFYYVFQDWGTIKYEGLKFTFEKYGEKLYFYHYEYYFKGPDNQVYKNNVYLRHDPRKNKIPVEEEIIFNNIQPIYISINSQELKSCNDSVIAVATLSQFLANNFLNIKGATPNETEAKEKNITFANCTSHPEHNVIVLQSGENTKISKEENCYLIDINNCEIQQAVERFVVQALVDAKKRYNLK